MVKVKLENNYKDMSERVARAIAKEILVQKAPVLGLPTGKTPEAMYNLLVKYYEDGLVDFSKVTTFNLDEYYPITKDDPKSFHHYMEERLLGKVNLEAEHSYIPDPEVPRKEIENYCTRYEEEIRKTGGIDLQILGIGGNGHIGFNEPGASFDSRTRLVKLTEETLEASFDEVNEAPKEAITMGIKTIMEAKKIILFASGKRKRTAVKRAIEGPITEDWPASALQLHPNVTAVLDKSAAESLELAGVNELTG